MNPYDEAHLFVATIRILQFQLRCAPAIEDICAMMQISTEAGHTLCRKLEQRGIVITYSDPFTLKLGVGNHLEIENLPRQEQNDNTMAKELEKFKAKKKNMDKKVESIQAELEARKKNMFKDLEEQFKKKLREE